MGHVGKLKPADIQDMIIKKTLLGLAIWIRRQSLTARLTSVNSGVDSEAQVHQTDSGQLVWFFWLRTGSFY